MINHLLLHKIFTYRHIGYLCFHSNIINSRNTEVDNTYFIGRRGGDKKSKTYIIHKFPYSADKPRRVSVESWLFWNIARVNLVTTVLQDKYPQNSRLYVFDKITYWILASFKEIIANAVVQVQWILNGRNLHKWQIS